MKTSPTRPIRLEPLEDTGRGLGLGLVVSLGVLFGVVLALYVLGGPL